MQDWIVIGAGATLKHYIVGVKKLIRNYNLVTIGINNMTDYIIPDYQLFTNFKRLKDGKVKFNKKLIITQKLVDLAVWIAQLNFDIISDDINLYRTAGCRAIQYAYDHGADNIYVAGMDGYTLCYGGDQHCWGFGNTDSDDGEYEAEKDAIIYNCLRGLKSSGIIFEIITPTVYNEFYNGRVI